MKRFARLAWVGGGVFILALSLFATKTLFRPGLLTGHDSESHIVRQIAFEEALKDGQFPPSWSKRPFQGLGSPVLMLNYQLPYMLAQVWRTFGFSFYESFEYTLIATYALSGVIAFLAFGSIFGWLAGIVGAVVYLFAPYRFVDIFVRAAFGEAVAFLFPPILFWALEKRKRIFGTLAWAGLFLSHPVGSAFFSVFFLGYAALRSWQESTWKYLTWFALTFFTAFLLASWNLIPTLALTRYTHYTPENSHPLKHFPSWDQLTIPSWGYGYSTEDYADQMSYQIGVAPLLLLGTAGGAVLAGLSGYLLLPKLRHRFPRGSRLWTGSFITGLTVLAIAFMLPVSAPLWGPLGLTNIIDFPWRILMAVVFGCSFVAAWLFQQRKAFEGLWRVFCAGMIILLAVYATRNYHCINAAWPWGEEYYFTQGPDGDAYGEYASATRQTRDGVRFASRAEVLEGDGSLVITTNQSHRIGVQAQFSQEGKVRFNSMYFPGWSVRIDGEKHDPRTSSRCSITQGLQTKPDLSGLIVCSVPPGDHTLLASYERHPVQTIGLLVSLAGTVVVLWWSYQLFFPRLMKLVRSGAFFGPSKKSSTPSTSKVK